MYLGLLFRIGDKMPFALIIEGKVQKVYDEKFPVHPSWSWLTVEEYIPNPGDIYKDGEIKPAPEIKPVYKVDPIAGLLTALSLFVAGTFTKSDVETAYQNSLDALSKMVIRIN
jgi:hypothetical protein